MRVWEEFHSTPLRKGEISRFLKFSEKVYGDYRVEGRYVISSKISDTRVCLNLMNEVKNLPYYIPDQEEIRLYYEEYVDVDAPEYKELRKFLEKRKHNPLSFAELMTALEDNLLLGGGVSQMFLLMKDAGIFLNETHEKRNSWPAAHAGRNEPGSGDTGALRRKRSWKNKKYRALYGLPPPPGCGGGHMILQFYSGGSFSVCFVFLQGTGRSQKGA